MQLNVARGAMSLVGSMGKAGHLSSLGLTQTDFNKLTGEVPWLAVDRNKVSQTFHTLMNGTIDVLGIQRFEIPAEWIAANIAMYIAPINVHVACSFFSRTSTAEALGRGVTEPNPVSSAQLFALVVQLIASPEASSARELFERNTGIAIERASLGQEVEA